MQLWSVPPELRPFSCSITTVTVHILGDVPSPPIVGALQESIGNWRATMLLLTSWLALSAAFYYAGAVAARTAVDYRPEKAVSAPREDPIETGGLAQ